MAPQTFFTEKNTRTNLPAQLSIYSNAGGKYELLYICKGGGSANKTQLYQKTKALLTEKNFEVFLFMLVRKDSSD